MDSDTLSIIQGFIGSNYGKQKSASQVNSEAGEHRDLKKIETYVVAPFASNELPFDDRFVQVP